MSVYGDSTILAINPAWSENAEPLNQTREATRDDLRKMVDLPVTLDAINTVTRSMNTVAELSPDALADIESMLAEYKVLETKRTEIQNNGSTWEGAAPLKRADVVEYDTSLLSDPNSIQIQTQGVNARMQQIETDIRTALNILPTYAGGARLYRS